MDIVKLLHWPRLLATGALSALLLSPCAVHALGIGEIVLQSRLGEPLHIQVELHVRDDEAVDDSCLSLTWPDPQEDDARGYLTRARLEIKNDAGRRYVDISSHASFNETFAKIRLRVKCPNTGAVIRTLTFMPDLPDPNESTFPVLAETPDSPPAADDAIKPAPKTDKAQVSEIGKAPGGTYPASHPAAAPTSPEKTAQRAGSSAGGTPPLLPATTSQLSARQSPGARTKVAAAKTARPAREQPIQSAHIGNAALAGARQEQPGKKPDETTSFRLKLSGAPLNVSRIGKISAKERKALRAQQKMLDADDLTARFLAGQHQLKQLRKELTGIKLQMAQLSNVLLTASSSVNAAPVAQAKAAAPAVSAPSAAAAPVVAASSPVARQSRPRPLPGKPPIALSQPSGQESVLLEGAYIAAGLVLAALALLLGVRYLTRIRSRKTAASALHRARQKHLNSELAPADAPWSVAQPPVQAESMQPLIAIPGPAAAKEDAAPSAEPTPRHVPAPDPAHAPEKRLSKNVVTPAQLDAALQQQQLTGSASRPDDTPNQESEPLYFWLESPTGKNPAADVNFEQDLDKTVVLDLGSPASIPPQVPNRVADVNFEPELDKTVVLDLSRASIPPHAPDRAADVNFEQDLDKTVVLDLSRTSVPAQAPDRVAGMNVEQDLDKTIVLDRVHE